jgi:serine phosphatase RsbU (regulator of sigma subunit)/CHASE2 domain-containing sensor protein
LKRFITGFSQVWRFGKGRPVALALLTVIALLLNVPDLQPFKAARLSLFDGYQKLLPRQSQSQSVVIVGIDEETLRALGQWPWPRNYFAALIDSIAALKPAAVGLDIIMPESDRASPEAVAESRTDLAEGVRKALAGATSNDHQLAISIAGAPIVLGVAGFKFKTSATVEGLRTQPIEVEGADPLHWLNTYPYLLASMPEFQAAAHGQALLSSDPENGIVRRTAVLSSLNGTIMPGLSLEMLRVAHAARGISVEAGSHGVEAVNIGSQRIPLQGNGEAWVHFDEFSEQRYISALNLLKNEIPPERIAGKLVLVGLTGLGLQDLISTSLGDRRPGVEVHAQLIESFEEGHFLTRPWWMIRFEFGVLVCAGIFLIWFVPDAKSYYANERSAEQLRGALSGSSKGVITQPLMQERRRRDRSVGIQPTLTVMLVILQFLLLFGAGIVLFRWGGLLFDAANLFIALGIVFLSLLCSVLIEAGHQRKNAELALQNQRVKAAQLAGELDAARRIQLGTLPVAATAFPGETRFAIEAMLEPARQVGGDLYDFFMMDRRRLFFIVGDVSGKGLPASLFMVVTKALGKSAALRGIDGIGAIITMSNMELARENSEMLFVTAVAGILDVETGALEMVNAGHDAPWRIGTGGNIESLNGEGGPPLCVLDDFTYPVEHFQLQGGDTLLLLTDGITEAMNANNELYGMERVSRVLNRVPKEQHPTALAAALREDVRLFVGETEPSDDLTLLVLRWYGA